MGATTGIEWCDTTVNPTTGCDGCELWKLLDKAAHPPIWGGPCYAGNLHEMRLAKSLPKLYAPRFTEVRLAPGRMAKAAGLSDLTGTDRPEKPWLNGMPRLIFVGDMGDLFSRDVPFEYIRDEVFGVATSAAGSRHVWMLLTKQPSRMMKFAEWFGEWPENVWAGVSVTGLKTVLRIGYLLQVPAARRFVSFEPLVENVGVPIELFGYGDAGSTTHYKRYAPVADRGIELAIIGGESHQNGHGARPFDVAWARRLIQVARDTPLKVFLKQLGSNVRWSGCSGPGEHWPNGTLTEDMGCAWRVRLKDGHGGDWSEWPEDLRVREFPRVAAVA